MYKATKPSGNFTIANLEYRADGELHEAYAHSGNNFAVYRSADTDKGAVLNIPSLGLKLNINFYDLATCLGGKKEVKKVENLEEIHGDFSYALLGADWGIKYPACNREQQSPINLIDSISKYG